MQKIHLYTMVARYKLNIQTDIQDILLLRDSVVIHSIFHVARHSQEQNDSSILSKSLMNVTFNE